MYAGFSETYTRIDPDGTTHRWDKKVEFIGSAFEICQTIGFVSTTLQLPGTIRLEDQFSTFRTEESKIDYFKYLPKKDS